jgi:hypothetical protein
MPLSTKPLMCKSQSSPNSERKTEPIEVKSMRLKRSISPEASSHKPNKIQRAQVFSKSSECKKAENPISSRSISGMMHSSQAAPAVSNKDPFYNINSANTAQAYYEQLAASFLNNPNAFAAAYTANLLPTTEARISPPSSISPLSSISSNNSSMSSNMPSVCSKPNCNQCLHAKSISMGELDKFFEAPCPMPNCTHCKKQVEPMFECCWLIDNVKCGQVFSVLADLQHHVNTHTLVNIIPSLGKVKKTKYNNAGNGTQRSIGKSSLNSQSYHPYMSIQKNLILPDSPYTKNPSPSKKQGHAAYFDKSHQLSKPLPAVYPFAHYPPITFNP